MKSSKANSESERVARRGGFSETRFLPGARFFRFTVNFFLELFALGAPQRLDGEQDCMG
jgi:hypothetical protein